MVQVFHLCTMHGALEYSSLNPGYWVDHMVVIHPIPIGGVDSYWKGGNCFRESL